MKYKACPKCNTLTIIEWHDTCIFCGGGDYYHCTKCDADFKIKKDKSIGKEI